MELLSEPSLLSAAKELVEMIDGVFDSYEHVSEQNEHVIFGIIQLCEMLRVKWHDEKQKNILIKKQISTLQEDIDMKTQDLKSVKAQLNDARAHIASLVEQKKCVETERDEYEQQIDLVKELLKSEYIAMPDSTRKKQLAFIEEPQSLRSRKGQKLKPSAQFLNTQMSAAISNEQQYTNEHSIDFDQSEPSESEMVRHSPHGAMHSSVKRHLKEDEPTPQPRSKRSKEESTPLYQTQRFAPNHVNIKIEEPSHHFSSNLNREISYSENSLATGHSTAAIKQHQTTPVRTPTRLGARTPASLMKSLGDLRTPSSATQHRYTWLSAGIPLEKRTHTMHSKQILRSDICDTCGEKIPFARTVHRCTDCRYTCHPQCEEAARLPCIPRVYQKNTFSLTDRIRLADYCTVMAPSLPHILVHCVVELERRNVNYAGLYRVPGSDGRVNELMQRFMRDRAIPNLSREDDMATITGLVKKFLMLLESPLIPPVSWQRFVDASKAIDSGDVRGYDVMHSEIEQLPMANRDTLSYLIMHWQKVAEAQDLTKMPIESLSKVLAPTVIGFGETNESMEKLPLIERVMYRFLEADAGYWHHIFGANLGSGCPASIIKINRLGGTPNTHSLLNAMCGTNLISTQTPGRQLRTHKSKSRFFQSPW